MIRKLITGVMLASLAVTALAPAAASAHHGGGQTLKDRLVTMNERTGQFDTLIAAAACYGDVVFELLDGADQTDLPGIKRGTLFAPTDRAFAKSLPGVTNPCDLDSDLLLGVLLDHVSYDRISNRELRKAARRNGEIETIGGDVDVSGRWWRPRLGSQHGLNDDGVRDTARVIYNRGASNGVLRVVDRVIVQS